MYKNNGLFQEKKNLHILNIKLSTILISDFFFLMLTTVYNNYKKKTIIQQLYYALHNSAFHRLTTRQIVYNQSCALCKRESVTFNTVLFWITHTMRYILPV